MSALVQNDRRRKIQIYLYTVSASLGDALLFVTLALGAAIKREFIYISYFVYFFILSVFMSLIQERLLLTF